MLIGLNIGCHYASIVTLTKEGLKTILNESGNRQTPVSITYLDTHRVFGETSSLMKSKGSTFQGISLIGAITNKQNCANSSITVGEHTVAAPELLTFFSHYLLGHLKESITKDSCICIAVPNGTQYVISAIIIGAQENHLGLPVSHKSDNLKCC